MVSHKSTAKEVSFEWSHHRISSTDSKVRTTLYSVINSIIIKFRYNARSDWLKERALSEYRARSDEGGPISVFASAF